MHDFLIDTLLPSRIASYDPTDHSTACPSWLQPFLPVQNNESITSSIHTKTRRRPLKNFIFYRYFIYFPLPLNIQEYKILVKYVQ